ncbi:MAG: DUF1826 domain-containing protein [Pseudomonadota bacterium]
MTSARQNAWDFTTAPVTPEHRVDVEPVALVDVEPVALMDGVRTVETRDGLATIKEPGTELVIWQRSLPSPVSDWLDRLDVESLPYLRILVQPDDLQHALEPLLDKCGMAACDMRDHLVDDIDRLVRAFAAITDSDSVDVRLERVDHDACWKFHRDTVEARLVTTYRGPTTQWVRMAQAEEAITGQKDYNGPLERLGDHDVALFKGNCAGPNSGVVHRSPPIAGTGLSRLFLCLNKQTVISPDPWVRA